MTSSQNDLERWFGERPAWMREAARRLIQNCRLDDDHIRQLVQICKAEVGIYENGGQRTNSIPTAPVRLSFQVASRKNSLRLLSVLDMRGINALAPRKPLMFDSGPLVIVYGLNASGKSGYIRVLKHASGQRKPGPLHADVFSVAKGEQSCKFSCEIDGVTRELHWSFSKGPLDELHGLQVFDSNGASIYINEENEAAYEPFEL